MKWSESIKNIAPAMTKVTEEIKDAYKEKEGFGYQYAPLDQVLKIVRPILAKNDLSLIQSERFDEDKVVVETLLLHKSGEWIMTEVSAPYEKLRGMNSYQITGSALTYLRRYGLSAAVGMTADEDNDAAGEPEQLQTINQDQVLELEKLISKTKTNKEKFLQFFKIKSLEEMKENVYQKAVAVLMKKIKKGAA